MIFPEKYDEYCLNTIKKPKAVFRKSNINFRFLPTKLGNKCFTVELIPCHA